MSETILAVDFGTTHSLVGAFHKGKEITQIPLDPYSKDPTLMRTLLFFPDPDQCFYGVDAINKFIEFGMEGRLFRSFKSHLPNQGYLGTVINNRILTLESMIGIFLLEIKKRSEAFLKTKIDKVVLGRPARYSMDVVADEFAFHRMRKAAEFAGFKDIVFVPEPLAAALEFRKKIEKERTILIGDFGGGTSDFTILNISKNDFQKKDVLAVDGCPLAGDALDSVFMSHRLNQTFGAHVKYQFPMANNVLTMPASIMDRLNKPAQIVHLKEKETYHFIKEVQKCTLQEVQKKAIDRLFVLIEDQQIFSFFEQIEKTKIELSSSPESHFSFNYPDLETVDHFKKQDFELWSEKIKFDIFAALERTLDQAKLGAADIDHVFLTGGTAHVPFVQEEFEKRFGRAKLESKNFFHSIMYGLIESAKQWKHLQ
jgi:hypothetical chaperone protein